MGGAQAFTRERITMPFSSLRSNPVSNIVSRFSRCLCKPAWFAGSLQLYSDCPAANSRRDKRAAAAGTLSTLKAAGGLW